ncbi:MAG: (2Fe-2S) ferredoxin domain-containing protein [Planctomycetes bacterium]|nr:(2Fe-2S) ferredoxin domain-containing protein [Planctomycetota bacterium]
MNKIKLLENAEKLGIGKYSRHVLLCTGPSCCTEKEGLEAWEELKKQIKEQGLTSGDNACYRTKVGCLRLCESGPIATVYPEGVWYANLSKQNIEAFVKSHLVNDTPLEDLVIAKNPLPKV